MFHPWNRAQESGTAAAAWLVATPPWTIALPDLRSRLGAALQLEIGLPDDAMAEDLLHALAEQRGLPLAAERRGLPRRRARAAPSPISSGWSTRSTA